MCCVDVNRLTSPVVREETPDDAPTVSNDGKTDGSVQRNDLHRPADIEFRQAHGNISNPPPHSVFQLPADKMFEAKNKRLFKDKNTNEYSMANQNGIINCILDMFIYCSTAVLFRVASAIDHVAPDLYPVNIYYVPPPWIVSSKPSVGTDR